MGRKITILICVFLMIFVFSNSSFSEVKKNGAPNDLDAKYKLGLKYIKGDGVPQDSDLGVKLVREAADSGHVLACGLIGELLFKIKNYESAFKYIKCSADNNTDNELRHHSQMLLGAMYAEGHGVEKNEKEAFSFFMKAALEGDAPAQAMIGMIYLNGVCGQLKDDEKAAEWYAKAAEAGNAASQLFLGAMYQDGIVFPKDYVLAYMWYNLAASKGNQKAAAYRNNLASRMTPAQIAEAQRLSREWRPKRPKP